MSYDVSTTSPVSAAATDLLPERGDTLADSFNGIGDIVMAGERSGYTHLSTRALPTVGRLVTAARGAAEALADRALWPGRRGRWQLAPRAARRHTRGRMRVTVVALEPNGFVPLTGARPSVSASDVLYLVSGRAHAVVTGDGGRLLAVQELAERRARVLGSAGGHQLVNTGTETAVVVRVTA
ncbi:hypothetical protein [Actinorugispora endophytica]|uniref:Cupin domain-containing protein n=1 Tax=Actinorugispora endophytica TaxID=1605990 RepID=A0A4R6V8X5_9ACTN|nr:hypothetical protein [Actinorugispora endophytica]TDQ55238.1 hypothetical protein EV190_101563 [Actinorugispora endophytica]